MAEDRGVKGMSLGDRIRRVRSTRALAELGLLISKHRPKVILYEANISTPSPGILSNFVGKGNMTERDKH